MTSSTSNCVDRAIEMRERIYEMQPTENEGLELILEVESQFYESKREEYVEEFPDRFLLIYGAELIGDYETFSDATDEGVRRFGPGPFLVRKSGEDELVLTTFTLMMAG